MQSTLRQKLNELATHFADGVLAAIRTSPLEELMAGAAGSKASSRPANVISDSRTHSGTTAPGGSRRKSGGRLPRRSSEDISRMLNRIVMLLRGNPSGLRAEQIRAQLGVSAKELPKPLAEGINASSVRKTGQKRATTYFAASSGRVAPTARAGQKTSPRVAARRAQSRKR